MPSIRDRRALAVLALITAAGFGYRLGSLGFYNDDYTWLFTFSNCVPATFMNLARALSHHDSGFAARLGGLVYFPVLYLLCGLKPVLYQSIALATDYAVAWNFYRYLRSEDMGETQALLTAGLAALYPNHDSTHHWVTGAPLALAGTFWALRAAREGARTNSVPRRAAAVLVFIYSALLYESAALLAVLPAAIDFFRGRFGPMSARTAGEALRKNLLLPFCLAAAVAYQRIFVPLFQHIERHHMSIHPGHVLKVFQVGLECTFLNRLTDEIRRATIYAWGHFGVQGWLFFLGACALIAASSAWFAKESRETAPDDLLPILAASFFVLGYMPYFFDATYMPSIFDATNRLNLVGSFGGASFFAWLILKLRAAGRPAVRKAGAILLGASFCAFLMADQVSNDQWARAYLLQQKILSDVASHVQAVPDPAMILLYGFPERMGSGVVFESTYDFNLAQIMHDHRPRLRGLVGQGRVRFEKDLPILSWFGETPLSYDNLYVYDESADLFQRIPDQKTGDEFLSAYAQRQLSEAATR